MDRTSESPKKRQWNASFHDLAMRMTLVATYFIALLFFTPAYSQTEKSLLLVVFKEDKSSITSAYKEIITGIELHSDLRVIEKVIGSALEEAEINQIIEDNNAAAIVLLGRNTIDLFENITVKIPIITGGTLYPNPSKHILYGLSLTPDPSLLFSRLKAISPNITNIHVVYDPKKYQWLIDLAKVTASNQKINIISYEANDLRSSAKIHRDIIQASIPNKDAIWLLQDAELVGESDVLPYLLKEAWQREIVILSSNPRHVQRGALLSLYAEKELSGQELGTLAKQVVHNKGGLQQYFFPAQQVKSTVNIRSARHLGIRFNSEQLSSYDLIFPKK